MNILLKTAFALSLAIVPALTHSHDDETHAVFAPLPPTARSDPIGPSGWAVEDFGGGAYMVTEGSYQSLFLVSNEGVILVDGKMYSFSLRALIAPVNPATSFLSY